ncbi:MAG: hypothetical protein LBE32_07720, partial [Burkholderiales bacterium]|nr:hypothetical protein [Burkholderiales bacterium]
MLTGLCQRPALSSLWRFLLESCFGKNRKTAESDKTAGSLKQTTRLPLQVARFFLALMGAAILSVFA